MALSPSNANSSHIIQNCLLFAYKSLRSTDRFVQNSLLSPYEKFYADLSVRCLGKKLEMSIPNSEVEAFYTKRFLEKDFIGNVHSRVLHAIGVGGTAVGALSSPTTPTQSGMTGGASTSINSFNQFSTVYSLVWELLSKQNSDVCNKLPLISGRQLWELFLKLDRDSVLKLHVDDIVDLILRIFKANGHEELPDNIKEWFCGEEAINFWSFFHQIVEKYIGLLQVNVIQEVHQDIVSEVLREGKLEKKGHVVHNWKMRWFVLTMSSLMYFESRDKMLLKGSVVINGNSQVQNVLEFKSRHYRFKITCEDPKSAMDISAPDKNTMGAWIIAIRMAIKMQCHPGRNFLHKYRLAQDSQNSVRSRQLTRHTSLQEPQYSSYSTVVASDFSTYSVLVHEGVRPDLVAMKGRESIDDSIERTPPLPSRRIYDSSDNSDNNPKYVNHKVFDNMRERRNEEQQVYISRKQCSSTEDLPTFIDHIVVGGDEYAVVQKVSSKINKQKEKDLDDLTQMSVNAPLSLDYTGKIDRFIQEQDTSPTTSPLLADTFPLRTIKSKPGSISMLPVSPVPHKRPQNIEAKLTTSTSDAKLPVFPVPHKRAQNVEINKLKSPTRTFDAGYAMAFGKVQIDDQKHENEDAISASHHRRSVMDTSHVKLSRNTKDPNRKEPPYVNVRRDL